MIYITGSSIEGVKLNTLESKIDQGIVDKFNIKIEYDSNKRIETLSIRSVYEFLFNGILVNFDNLNTFLNKNKYVVHDGSYVFIDLNLVLYLNIKEKYFYEILIYAESLSYIYEKEDPITIIENNPTINFTDFDFIPYKSLGDFKFGMQESLFTSQYGLTYLGSSDRKAIYQIDNFMFRFDKEVLTQVLFEYPKSSDVITLASVNLNDSNNLKKLISENKYLESFSHIIFTELGLAIGKDYKNIKERDFFFFDQSLLPFWKNTKRPITSW